jgi:hypothetical protein
MMILIFARSEVVTAVDMEFTLFRDVIPCRRLKIYRHLEKKIINMFYLNDSTNA